MPLPYPQGNESERYRLRQPQPQKIRLVALPREREVWKKKGRVLREGEIEVVGLGKRKEKGVRLGEGGELRRRG